MSISLLSSIGAEKKINGDEPSAHCHHLQVMDKTQENNDRLGLIVVFCRRR
jgi:hypothetical protein